MRPTDAPSIPASSDPASTFTDEDTLPSVDTDDLEDVLGGCQRRRSGGYECTVIQPAAPQPVPQAQPDRRRMLLPLLMMSASRR